LNSERLVTDVVPDGCLTGFHTGEARKGAQGCPVAINAASSFGPYSTCGGRYLSGTTLRQDEHSLGVLSRANRACEAVKKSRLSRSTGTNALMPAPGRASFLTA